MAEIITSFASKQKLKVAAGPTTKRIALSVIDNNIASKDNNSLKLHGKSVNQQIFPNKVHAYTDQKFKIFEDEVDENKACECFAETSLEVDVSDEHFEFSPKINKDTSLLLLDLENEGFCHDSVWCSPYRQDIYHYFKSVEQQFHPNANYMEKQSDVTMNMRSVLVDWLVEVGEEYKLHSETLYLAVSYTDRFLSHISVLRAKLQLVGTASMFLAAKYEEIYPPEMKDFVYITDDTYTKKQILRMEHLILTILKFDLSAPTAYSFLQLYCSISHAPRIVINLSKYICELSLLDGNQFLKFIPSIVAAGSLALANYTVGFDMWDKILEECSGYELSELTNIIRCLYEKYSSMSTCPQQAICEKYKADKFENVTFIQHPEKLVFPSFVYL